MGLLGNYELNLFILFCCKVDLEESPFIDPIYRSDKQRRKKEKKKKSAGYFKFKVKSFAWCSNFDLFIYF